MDVAFHFLGAALQILLLDSLELHQLLPKKPGSHNQIGGAITP
jgi:hypothetical protein